MDIDNNKKPYDLHLCQKISIFVEKDASNAIAPVVRETK